MGEFVLREEIDSNTGLDWRPSGMVGNLREFTDGDIKNFDISAMALEGVIVGGEYYRKM